MKRKFKVLYTHQKTKKHKTWHDGTLTLALNDDTRGSLTDDSKQQLTTLYLDKLLVEPGVEFDSGKYLIQVEEEIETSNLSQNGDHKATKMPAFSNKQSKALSLSKSQSVNVIAPLKRKRGFVVPRRAPDFTCDPQTSPNKSKVVPALSNDIGIWSSVNEADDNKPDFCGSANHVRGANDLLKMLGGLKHTEHDDNLKSDVTSLSFQPCKIEESEVKEKAVPSCSHSPIVEANEENQILVNLKSRFVREIIFPTKDQANDLPFNSLPAQFTLVPLSYASVEEYISTWSAVLYEQINKRIWEKGENFHALMQAADMSKLSGYSTELNETYTLPELKQTCSITDEELASMEPPYCSHERPSKICRVTKEGANQGRAFFTCALGKRKCNYFKWADDPQPKLRPQILPTSSRQVKINNERSLVAYLNRGNIDLYMNCQTVRKSRMTDGTSKSTAHLLSHGKRLLYLKLSRTSKSLCNIKGE